MYKVRRVKHTIGIIKNNKHIFSSFFSVETISDTKNQVRGFLNIFEDFHFEYRSMEFSFWALKSRKEHCT